MAARRYASMTPSGFGCVFRNCGASPVTSRPASTLAPMEPAQAVLFDVNEDGRLFDAHPPGQTHSLNLQRELLRLGAALAAVAAAAIRVSVSNLVRAGVERDDEIARAFGGGYDGTEPVEGRVDPITELVTGHPLDRAIIGRRVLGGRQAIGSWRALGQFELATAIGREPSLGVAEIIEVAGKV